MQQQPRHERHKQVPAASRSPFLAGFRVVASFHSIFACNVVRNVRSEDLADIGTYTRPSLYVAFVAASLLVLISNSIRVSKKMAEVVLDKSDKYKLYKAYLLLFLVLAEVNALFNGIVAFSCASLYVKLIRACCAIEEQILLPPEETRMAVRYASGTITWQVFTSFWPLIVTGGDFEGETLHSLADISPFLYSFLSALKYYAILQLSIWAMIPILWRTYFARTLRIIKQMDKTRTNLDHIKVAWGLASTIVFPVFMVALAISVVSLSVAVHCSSTGTTFSPRIRIFFAGWTLVQVVNLLWPVLAWQRIKRQLTSTRHIVQKLELPEGAPTSLSEHVLMLQQWVDTDDFKNSFGGFLNIEPSAVAGVIGATVAYIVLLRQTTASLTAGGAARCRP